MTDAQSPSIEDLVRQLRMAQAAIYLVVAADEEAACVSALFGEAADALSRQRAGAVDEAAGDKGCDCPACGYYAVDWQCPKCGVAGVSEETLLAKLSTPPIPAPSGEMVMAFLDLVDRYACGERPQDDDEDALDDLADRASALKRMLLAAPTEKKGAA